MGNREHAIEQLNVEIRRKDAQILEAIAILESGTDYEKLHVSSILRNALSTNIIDILEDENVSKPTP